MKLRQVSCALVMSAVFLGARAARADLVTNGSFETGTYAFGGDGAQDLSAGSTVISGWTVVTNHISPLNTPNSYSIVPEDGKVSLDLQGYSDGSPYGGVTQNITTVIGEAYTLSFWIGVQNDVSYAVEPVSVLAAAGLTSQTYTNALTGAGQQWEQFELPFIATDTTTAITLSGVSTEGGAYIGLDNVSVAGAAVPEPASLACLICGIAPLMMRRRRKSVA